MFKNSNCVLQTIVIRLLDIVKSEFVNNACCIWEPVARGGDKIIWKISGGDEAADKVAAKHHMINMGEIIPQSGYYLLR